MLGRPHRKLDGSERHRAMENPGQAGLFEDNASLPHGPLYLTDLITRAEEQYFVGGTGSPAIPRGPLSRICRQTTCGAFRHGQTVTPPTRRDRR